MATPISFDPYMGWVDITDPDNIPVDARLITAADLIRYENLGQAVETFSGAIAQEVSTLSNATMIRIPPQQFTGRSGSPTLATGALGMAHWALDQTAVEAIITYATIPQAWVTYDVVLVTAAITTATGNVRMQATITTQGVDGAPALGAVQTAPITVITAPGNLVRKDVAVVVNHARTGTGEILLRIDRIASDATDTLAADYAVLFVELRKKS